MADSTVVQLVVGREWMTVGLTADQWVDSKVATLAEP